MREWQEWNTGRQAALTRMWEAYCHGCTGSAVCDAAAAYHAAAEALK